MFLSVNNRCCHHERQNISPIKTSEIGSRKLDMVGKQGKRLRAVELTISNSARKVDSLRENVPGDITRQFLIRLDLSPKLQAIKPPKPCSPAVSTRKSIEQLKTQTTGRNNKDISLAETSFQNDTPEQHPNSSTSTVRILPQLFRPPSSRTRSCNRDSCLTHQADASMILAAEDEVRQNKRELSLLRIELARKEMEFSRREKSQRQKQHLDTRRQEMHEEFSRNSWFKEENKKNRRTELQSILQWRKSDIEETRRLKALSREPEARESGQTPRKTVKLDEDRKKESAMKALNGREQIRETRRLTVAQEREEKQNLIKEKVDWTRSSLAVLTIEKSRLESEKAELQKSLAKLAAMENKSKQINLSRR